LGSHAGSTFLRSATGLVREFSWFDAFVISIAAATPSIYTFSSQILFIVTADPGANVVTSTLLGFIFSIPLAITYFLMASAIPRSGGDYIWVSRFLNPTVGFMAAWAFWIASVAVVGIISFLEGSVVIPITLASFGYSLHIPSLVSVASTIAAPANVFVIGMVMIILASTIAASGPRSVSRVMILLFGLTTLGTLVCFYVLAASSHTDFVNALNGFGGTDASYAGILSAATSTGWSYVPMATGVTIISIPLSVLLFAGFNYSVGASGEVKNARKSMFAGTIGALIFALIINIVGVQLGVSLVGYRFLQASIAVGSGWPFAAPPWIPFFVAMLIHNPVLLVLMNVGWLVGLLWVRVLVGGSRWCSRRR
jgi:APA family basic amino acid/polyamine antiporter